MSLAIQERCSLSEQPIFARVAKGYGGGKGKERAAVPAG